MLLKQRRRVMWLWVSLILSTLILYSFYARDNFVDFSFDSGLVLMAAMILLTLYNLKKKFSFLPTGMTRNWTQIHLYVGFISYFLFLIHVDFKLPTGALEILLAILYNLVFITGIFGIIITRFFPGRLTARGREVIFENIPIERRKLREQTEQLILETAKKTESKHLVDFYQKELLNFFSTPSHALLHLIESRRPLRVLFDKVDDLKRYCNQEEITCLNEVNQYIEDKDHLDYHHSLQGCLKLWLFTHIPLAYSLLIFATLHMLMVFSYRGRIPL